MTRETDAVLDALDHETFPMLHRLLETDAAPVLRQELSLLLAREWLGRADRVAAGVSARILGDGFDEACVVENVSATGVLTSFSPEASVALDRGGIVLRVQAPSGSRDVPLAFVRVGRVSHGRYEAAFSFSADPQDVRGLAALLAGATLSSTSPTSPNR